MKKWLLLTFACVSLLAPVTAEALGLLNTQARIGTQTSQRVATGSCSVSGSADGLTLRCLGSTGIARAVYNFRLPANAGKPSVHVSLAASRTARTAIARDGTSLTVTVTRRGAGSARILMVSVSYYAN